MCNRYVDLTGQRFGRLVVVSYSHSKCGQTYWECNCDCGNKTIVQRASLIKGYTKSCGCYNADKQKTHGMTKTRIYQIWSNMKARCDRKNCPAYKDYGGRGIKIYNNWYDFSEFYKWSSANGYNENLTIDRIDVNGNYCPENCRWVSMKEQRLNKRDSLYFFGYPLKEVCKKFGISYKLVWKYKKQNGSIEDGVLKALQTKIKKITAHIQRLRDEEQTPEIIAEIEALIVERNEKVAEIKSRYPYKIGGD